MALDIVLTVIGGVLMILGIIGCILPVLPGVVFSYAGLLCLHFTSYIDFSWTFLIAWALVVLIVELLDYFVPIWGTKTFGGGKKGAIGSMIGVFLGIFILPPWGLILFPFVGAVVGELLDEKEGKQALKAGFGAFVGFVAGTLMQLVVAIIMALWFLKEVVTFYW